MRIVDSCRDDTPTFNELDIGDAFIFRGEWYIKIQEIELSSNTLFNAIQLNEGFLNYFYPNQLVSHRNVTFRVE